MSGDSFDCIIVGARCAGAPLATHLARAGQRVCVVDAAKIPSDQPFSTHAIQPSGLGYLDELGVGDSIRKVTPAVRASRLDVGGATVDVVLAAGREMYCPRRSVLDPLLADAAVAAGADLRDETAVLDLLRDGERVTGVHVRSGDRSYDLRARLVVGADGRNSIVARRVKAAEYHGFDGPRAGYWGYFPATRAFDELPFQTYIEIIGNDARFAFRTDSDLVIAGSLSLSTTVQPWRSDIQGSVLKSLGESAVTRMILEGGNRPVAPLVGLIKLRSFFRVPVGPGWALVGDAGLHKDPTAGYGITDALRDAKALSVAVLDGREAALEVYWRERDVKAVPLFAHASAMGSIDYDNPFNRLIVSRVSADPAFEERLRAVIERRMKPFEMVSTWQVLGWTAGALLRGQTDIFPGFLDSLKRGTWEQRESARRQKLLDVARQKLSA
jgi:flavin-dependent dehydrogenase